MQENENDNVALGVIIKELPNIWHIYNCRYHDIKSILVDALFSSRFLDSDLDILSLQFCERVFSFIFFNKFLGNVHI
jgi:hypothetical protein